MMNEVYIRDGWEKEASKDENLIVVEPGQKIPQGYHPITSADIAEGLKRQIDPTYEFFKGEQKNSEDPQDKKTGFNHEFYREFSRQVEKEYASLWNKIKRKFGRF